MNSMNRFHLLRAPVFLFAFCLLTPALFAGVTAEQRQKAQDLVQQTREAGALYSSGKLVESAEQVMAIQKDFVELMKSKDPALHRLVRPLYTRLGNAHALLELQGASLDPLPSWQELTSDQPSEPEENMPMEESDPSMISFSKDVAPWLVTSCGNCHIRGARGDFSLATFEALMKGPPEGTVIFPGESRGSRIVEVIESGDMPRGGAKVSAEQLASLKAWIDQGAKFDGPEPTTMLTSFSAAEPAADATMTPKVELAKATGDESVSFARDIAPILTENCNGCHIAGRQGSGGFRMDNFSQLLRGGDSGSVISGRNADKSLIVQKLKGESGQRMPAGGRPALSAEQITLISTWIREGSKFDGPSPATNINTVKNQAWAEDASHEELFERRQQRTLAMWNRVLPNDEPASLKNNELFVLGNVSPAQLDPILKRLDNAITIVKKQLDAPAKDPLVKGGISVFVLKSRYDYSEFGRMTENRELPKFWLGHWNADPLDVYGVLASGEADGEDQEEAIALQIIAAAYLGGFSDVPTWFAEGVARNLVITNHRRGDARVDQWRAALPLANQKVENAKTLIEGRLDEEAAGIVGMAITNIMMDRTNRRRFDTLLKLLREKQPFDQALTATYAAPEVLIKSWIGK